MRPYKFKVGDKVITPEKTKGHITAFDTLNQYWVEIRHTEDGRKIDCLFSEEELELEPECQNQQNSPSS